MADAADQNFPAFFFKVGTRFAGIKKAEVDQAKSVHDFLPSESRTQMISINSVRVYILNDSRQVDSAKSGGDGLLTSAQINLLQSAELSTNILVRTDYLQKNSVTGELEESYSTPYRTIVPEKQAAYVSGKEALIKYLKLNSREKTAFVEKDKLQSAKLYFTVTKDGQIADVKLTQSSAYPSIDEAVINLIKNAPGKWTVAENSKGEKVDQRLVISFGAMGC